MARRRVVIKGLTGITPLVVDKASGKRVFLQAKRWHVLEIMAKTLDWARIAELGVFKGWTTLHLLGAVPRLSIIAVDRYEIPTGAETEGYSDYDRPDMDAMCRKISQQLAQFGDRVTLLRLDTVAAAAAVRDGSLDCVFVDADHREDHCLRDIDAWMPKLKPGGWMMGHDWHFPSVRAAVQRRLPEPVLFPDNVWGWRC